MAVIYLAGGCFWGTEKYLSGIRGVLSTKVGYANGNTENPSYEDVCRHGTGHAETVEVVYDSRVLPLPFLLNLYFESIDPTSVNRQGGDCGTQYRTGIYYTDMSDAAIVDASIRRLQDRFEREIAVESGPLRNFFPAEEYHQKYLEKNPGGYCHIGSDLCRNAAGAVVNPEDYKRSESEKLRSEISVEQYAVTQEGATEPPFRNAYWNRFDAGIYVDITTGEPLFASADKFESGCGWPSFSRPIDPNSVREKRDFTHGLIRTEVRSRVGDAHLGHVFTDGPEENGGLRYCINSASLRFIPKGDMEKEGYGYLLDIV